MRIGYQSGWCRSEEERACIHSQPSTLTLYLPSPLHTHARLLRLSLIPSESHCGRGIVYIFATLEWNLESIVGNHSTPELSSQPCCWTWFCFVLFLISV